MAARNNWLIGLKVSYQHILGYSPVGILAWYYPKISLIGLAVVRAGMEIRDVIIKSDTPAKAAIDFASSFVVPITVVLLRGI